MAMVQEPEILIPQPQDFSFTGSYKVALEGRRRLRVPAGMRKGLQDGDRVKVGKAFVQEMVALDGIEGGTYDPDNPGIHCVSIYPIMIFQHLIKSLNMQRDNDMARAAKAQLNQAYEETLVGAGGRIDVGDWVEELHLLGEEKEAELWVVGDGNRLLLMHVSDYARRKSYLEQPMIEADISRLIESFL